MATQAQLDSLIALVQAENQRYQEELDRLARSGKYDRQSEIMDAASGVRAEVGQRIADYMSSEGLTKKDVTMSVKGSNNDQFMDLGAGNLFVYGPNYEPSTAVSTDNFRDIAAQGGNTDYTSGLLGDYTLLDEQDTNAFDNPAISLLAAALAPATGGLSVVALKAAQAATGGTLHLDDYIEAAVSVGLSNTQVKDLAKSVGFDLAGGVAKLVPEAMVSGPTADAVWGFVDNAIKNGATTIDKILPNIPGITSGPIHNFVANNLDTIISAGSNPNAPSVISMYNAWEGAQENTPDIVDPSGGRPLNPDAGGSSSPASGGGLLAEDVDWEKALKGTRLKPLEEEQEMPTVDEIDWEKALKGVDLSPQTAKDDPVGDSEVKEHGDQWIWTGVQLVNVKTGEKRDVPNSGRMKTGVYYDGVGQPTGEVTGRDDRKANDLIWYHDLDGNRVYGPRPEKTWVDGNNAVREGTNPTPHVPNNKDRDGLLLGPGDRQPNTGSDGPEGPGSGPNNGPGEQPTETPTAPDTPIVVPKGEEEEAAAYVPTGNAYEADLSTRYTPTDYGTVEQEGLFEVPQRGMQPPPILPASNSGQPSYEDWLEEFKKQKGGSGLLPSTNAGAGLI
jgi:hypothetical protein